MLPPSSRRQADAHRASAFKLARVLFLLRPKKRVALLPSFFGAGDRTRTCTLARWNLNPMSLPIPPHPHIYIPCILSRWIPLVNGIRSISELPPALYQKIAFLSGKFVHLSLTFPNCTGKMDSVWCTLGSIVPAFHDNRREAGVCVLSPYTGFCYDIFRPGGVPGGRHA